MDRNDKARNEPTLADLEAFERLLRDSLKHDRAGAAPVPVEPVHAVSPAPVIADHHAAPVRDIPGHDAFAELTRLIEQPLSFEMPSIQAMPAPLAAEAVVPPLEWEEVGAQAPAAVEERNAFLPHPAPGEPDPFMAFEDDLRRFDATHPQEAGQGADAPDHGHHHGFDGGAGADHTIILPQVPQAEWHGYAQPEQPDSLTMAENRLAAESAAVAASEPPAGAGRSRSIFLGLGGIAVAGLAAIGATFAFGGKKAEAPKTVPVIAAKQEPTKEKPANPGGMDIPDQNKQVLAPKTAVAVDTKPAQVVNTTEQPVDLNSQVAKRDPVRVITPNPFQQPAPADTPAAVTPGATAGAPANPSEPRRVQSVRLSDPIGPTPQPTTPVTPPQVTAPSISNPGIIVGAAAAGAATIAAIAAGTATRTPAPTAPIPPKVERPVSPPAAATPPKAESRPVTASTAPRPVPSPVAAPSQRQANAPISLVNPATPRAAPAARTTPAARPAAPATGGAGGFAVQLAARPTAEDARTASSQLGSRYSGALGGKSPGVVSGQANGKTVYRIRVGGYSQGDANAACERVKSAGGSCFVTRQ